MKLKNIAILVFSLLAWSETMALEGAVIVLETPLFKSDNLNSKILDYTRQGSVIYIHPKHRGVEINSSPYDGLAYNDDQNNSHFYTTLTKTGETAFILKKHVKLIFNDSRELKTSASPYKHDPMDYRLSEPIPDGFPLYEENKFRSSVAVGMGNCNKTNYQYTSEISKEEFGSQTSAMIVYSKKVKFDTSNRIYFGGMFNFSTHKNSFQLVDGTDGFERYLSASIGPYISYDAFRNHKFRITFAGGINFNYTRTFVEQVSISEISETRSFSGISIIPKLNTTISHKTSPSGLAFFIRMELQTNTPNTLEATSIRAKEENFWNKKTEDQISVPVGGQFSIYLGFEFSQMII